MCTYRGVNAHLSYCLNSVLYVKVLIGVFNHDQEKALVGAFSVIVKTGCETDGSICGTTFYTGLFSGDWRYTDLLYKTLSVRLILCPARLNPSTLKMSFTGLATESLVCQPLIVAWLSYSNVPKQGRV